MEKKYSFYGRLNEKYPSQIIVDVTEHCNLACIHCPHARFEKSQIFNGHFLDLEVNKKMVDEVRKYGKGITEYIRYTATGEPLLHPQIVDIISYAKKYSKTKVTITTNGTLLDEYMSKSLLDIELDTIDISIDAATPETYAKIRKNGNLINVQDNVLRFIKMRNKLNKRTKVVVSFVEQIFNKFEVKEFQRFWTDAGVDYVVIRRLHTAGGYKSKMTKIDNKEILFKERRPCVYPWERIILTPNGFLSYCPNCWNGQANIIDYRKTSIFKTWSSEFYKNLRKANLENDFQNYSFCGRCPDWKEVRWPDEGRSYADLMSEI